MKKERRGKKVWREMKERKRNGRKQERYIVEERIGADRLGK